VVSVVGAAPAGCGLAVSRTPTVQAIP